MELGGNAPFLVLADANVDDAVSGAMLARMRNGAPAYTVANRFYVAKEVATKFTSELTKAMSGLKMASGLSEGAQLGASVSIKERNKIAELVDASLYTGETSRAIKATETLQVEMADIKRGVFSDPIVSFSGVKQSGLSREGGFDGIHEFLEVKYIGIEI
jgi:acyl-CoA reductase-like NAD-dependent aldehyde dehydrogenase